MYILPALSFISKNRGEQILKSIYKYPLDVGKTRIQLPKFRYKVLSVGLQRGRICIWIEISKGIVADEEVRFDVIGTGDDMKEDEIRAYIGTVIDEADEVWHVFEVQ